MTARTRSRRALLVVACATAGLVAMAAPALAAPKPPAAGCTFDNVSSQTTCVSYTNLVQTDTAVPDSSGPGDPYGFGGGGSSSYSASGIVRSDFSFTSVMTVYQGKSAGSGRKVSTTSTPYSGTVYNASTFSCFY